MLVQRWQILDQLDIGFEPDVDAISGAHRTGGAAARSQFDLGLRSPPRIVNLRSRRLDDELTAAAVENDGGASGDAL